MIVSYYGVFVRICDSMTYVSVLMVSSTFTVEEQSHQHRLLFHQAGVETGPCSRPSAIERYRASQPGPGAGKVFFAEYYGMVGGTKVILQINLKVFLDANESNCNQHVHVELNMLENQSKKVNANTAFLLNDDFFFMYNYYFT